MMMTAVTIMPMATNVRVPSDSPSSPQPRTTATTGFKLLHDDWDGSTYEAFLNGVSIGTGAASGTQLEVNHVHAHRNGGRGKFCCVLTMKVRPTSLQRVQTAAWFGDVYGSGLS